MTESFKNTLIWLLAGTIGVAIAMTAVSASYSQGEYLPVGNDSFYHARRILDTVANPSSFFEFDPRIHVPEGSWISWPWFYDYFMAQQVRLVMLVTGATNPDPILMYIPVFWQYINIGLLLLIGIELGLPVLYRLLACLALALSPLAQVLHGTGVVDHHYMEFCMILASLLAGLRFFKRRDSMGRAAFLGFVLGIAPGIHNALFVLQIPMLGAFFLLWLRGASFPLRPLMVLAGAMLPALLLLLVASQPFREGFFDYYYLSYFHLYVTSSTVLILFLVGGQPATRRAFVLVLGAGLLLSIPLLTEIISVEGFLTRRIARLGGIMEARSPWPLIFDNPRAWLLGFYSILFALAPAVWLGSVWAAFRSRSLGFVYFSVFAVMGLMLAFVQVRLQYFGLAFMIMGPLLFGQWLRTRIRGSRIPVLIALLALYGVAVGYPVKERLFRSLPIGLDHYYGLLTGALPVLKSVCDADPGVVLTYNDAGHYVRYHTECSVIANNFLLTTQDEMKIAEIDRLFSMSVDQLLRTRPDIDYLLMAFPKLLIVTETGEVVPPNREILQAINAQFPLMSELLLENDWPKERLQLLYEFNFQQEDDTVALVRLFRVRH